MFIDASIIVAILAQEPGWERLVSRLGDPSTPKFTSPIAKFEAVISVTRAGAERSGLRPTARDMEIVEAAVIDIMRDFGIAEMPIDSTTGEGAVAASKRYGKVVGHRARLNLGDCFAYACAKSLNVPLLYKGDDFALTDLA